MAWYLVGIWCARKEWAICLHNFSFGWIQLRATMLVCANFVPLSGALLWFFYFFVFGFLLTIILFSQVCTVNNRDELEIYITSPNIKIYFYDPVFLPDLVLYKKLDEVINQVLLLLFSTVTFFILWSDI